MPPIKREIKTEGENPPFRKHGDFHEKKAKDPTDRINSGGSKCTSRAPDESLVGGNDDNDSQGTT